MQARRTLTGLAFAALLVSASIRAEGSSVTTGPTPVVVAPGLTDWGTTGYTAYTVQALAFSTYSQTDTWMPVNGSPDRYLTSGYFLAPLQAPSGASIEIVQFEGCDASSTGQVTVLVVRALSPAGGGQALGNFGSGFSETPGCGAFYYTLPEPIIVDNLAARYWLEIQTGGSSDTTISAVRAFYRLQVSPAPAMATFGDVPASSPQFQFIEALAASGITAGCGGGNYCPNNPVTRGQMAVFLAKALGLYWTN